MPTRILAIARKEFYQIWRDKRSLSLLLFVPAFMLFAFGFALSLDVTHVQLAIVDRDRTDDSRNFVQTFLHTDYFDLAGEFSTIAEAERLIERGDADVVLIVPIGFGKKILAKESVDVQALVDGDNSNSATAAASYVEFFAQNYSSLIRAKTLAQRGATLVQPIEYRPRIWFNPELKSSKFLVPGLMGFTLIVASVISTALAVVREKERGTMEQLIVSPVSSAEFLIGKLAPYALTACGMAVFIIVSGWLFFDIPVKGNPFILSAALFFFIIGGLGMGLMISTIAQTQEAAFFIAITATLLPTQILSGFIIPIENMPLPLQVVTTIVPAKYLLAVLRDVLLKDAPFLAYWQSFMGVVIFAALTMTVAIKRLGKTL